MNDGPIYYIRIALLDLNGGGREGEGGVGGVGESIDKSDSRSSTFN